ncbi:MAG: hypothetical protein FWD05_04460 [Oscillospiraceae bacterium]|nr:hypothetical protein [Oscillospiraceae bacterium]
MIDGINQMMSRSVRPDGAASGLEESMRLSGTIFDTGCNECIRCDTYYESQFQELAEEMQRLSVKLQTNSFCLNVGIINWDALFEIKSRMDCTQMLPE